MQQLTKQSCPGRQNYSTLVYFFVFSTARKTDNMIPFVLTVLLLSLAAVSPVGDSTTSHLTHGDKMVDVIDDGGNLRNAVNCTASGCKWPKSGKKVKVPYEISTAYSKKQRKFIIKILKDFMKSTCIHFIKRTEKHRDYLSFISANGCWSHIGRWQNRQQISLKANGCLFRDIVEHEVLHALGFHHEHVRSDRDDHVNIHYENIRPGREYNFEIQETNNLGTPYDFKSVMHYNQFVFSKNGKPTITAKDKSVTNFGTATEMSTNDYARVNKLYNC
ncbi:low choriolytic enzyme-like isoform X2 [Dunckerocampus dactyliophorus]|nr:low choriolytic enzyme-like isoform X2 [Dunckerocampus dactyliophorus]